VPPGPRGAVGFQLAAAGQQMFPYEPGAFFIADNEKFEYDVEEQISSGAWQLIAYNTGRFNHTLEIRFAVDLAADIAPASLAVLPAAAIGSAPSNGSGLPSLPLPPGLDLPPPLDPFGPPATPGRRLVGPGRPFDVP